MFDLHLHSTASDGLAPLEMVAAVLRAHPELRGVALTDHDHLESSVALAAIEPRAWVGLELTTRPGARRTVDVLALGVDPGHAGLVGYLAMRRAERVRRFDTYGEVLRELGWAWDPDPVVYDNPVIAKPHVVRELRRHPENEPRIAALPPFPLRDDADAPIYEYLAKAEASTGRIIDGEVEVRAPSHIRSTAESIDLVHAAGGIVILAHPIIAPYDRGRATRTRARHTITEWAEAGLDGIEVFHPDQSDAAFRDEVLGLADRLGLVVTAGSDDHSAAMGRVGTQLDPEHPWAREWWQRLQEARDRSARRAALRARPAA